MSWSKERVPKYRKHRSSGQAVVTINGVTHYLGPHGTNVSKSAYDRLIAEWLASGRASSYGVSDASLTIVELIAAYLKHVGKVHGVGPRSEHSQDVRALQPLRRLYGRSSATEFGVLQFKAVREATSTPGRSRPYVNELMRRVVALFKWAAAEGLLPAAIAQNLAIIPGLRRGKCGLPETEPVLPVDDAVIDDTLPHLQDVVADMVRLQRLTGARPDEVCGLRPCDVDRSGKAWIYSPRRHKTQHHGRDRRILIGPKAQAVLLRYLARDAEAHCFRPVDSEKKRRATMAENRKTPISYGNRPGTNRKAKPRRQPGERYTTESYRRAIHRGCDRAFPHPDLGAIAVAKLTVVQAEELARWQSAHRWSPNQLRHAAATEIRREFGLEAAQIVLGHAQADVTQVYAERDMAKGLEVAMRIG